MKLYYIGPEGGVVPLPEGWPRIAEHDEPDAEIAKAKLAFKIKGTGQTAYSKTPPKSDAPEEKE